MSSETTGQFLHVVQTAFSAWLLLRNPIALYRINVKMSHSHEIQIALKEIHLTRISVAYYFEHAIESLSFPLLH